MKNKNLFRDNWKDYFYLPNRARKGFLVLFLILSVEIIVLLYLHFIPTKQQPQDVDKFNADVDKFLASAQTDTDADTLEKFSDVKRTRQKIVYRNRDSSFITHHPSASIHPPRTFLIVDINTADTTELEKLNGIGPVKARIIYHYREKLGGFYSINQLHEVWGINDSLFESLEPHLTLSDSVNLKKINLNSAEVPELGKHPYIGFNLAKIIVNYRKEHGIFHSVNEIRKIPLITESLYFKIEHYLTILSN